MYVFTLAKHACIRLAQHEACYMGEVGKHCQDSIGAACCSLLCSIAAKDSDTLLTAVIGQDGSTTGQKASFAGRCLQGPSTR